MATESPTRSDRACSPSTATIQGSGEPSLERKLRATTLALVLILAGALLAVPGNQWRWFALGVGIILLVKILVQRLGKIGVRRRDLILAGVALAAGTIGLAFPEWPFVPVVLVAAGLALLGAAALGRGLCRS